MLFPVQDEWRLTTDFHEPRPLSRPPEKRDHPHGGWDIRVPVGTKIYAPENGNLYFHIMPWKFGRANENRYHTIRWHDGTKYAFRNYFYEWFGGLFILEGESGLTHVFAHIDAAEVFRASCFFSCDMTCTEDGTAYLLANLLDPAGVMAGNEIGKSGNAGLSTGPHIHYELHHKRDWRPHARRPDPADLWPDLYREKWKSA